MATRYELRVRDSNGDLTDRFGIGMPSPDGDVLRPFSYTKGVWSPGVLVLEVNGDHPVIDNLSRNSQVEVWRNVDQNGWYQDFLGLYLEDYDYEYRDQLDFRAYCPGFRTILQWGINAWKAATSNRSKFTSTVAETIAKTIVQYNLTSDATTGNGRELNWQGPFTITLEADGGGGNSLSWFNAWDNVFDSLGDLRRVAGGDFDLIRDPDDDGSYTKFEFRWYAGQRGRDLSSSIILGVQYGNIGNVKYQYRGSQVKTAAIVGGQGQEGNRDIEIRTATADAAGFHREAFVHATNVEKGNTAGLQSKGDAYLDEHGAVEKFTFDILQTEGAKYGVDYGINADGDLGVLGDIVTVLRPHDQVSETHKLEKVTVKVEDDGNESVSIETEKQ